MTKKYIKPEDIYVSVIKKTTNGSNSTEKITSGNKPSGNEIFDKMAEAILTRKKIYAASFAASVGLTSAQLSVYIKLYSGVSTLNWIAKYRMLMVKDFLTETRWEIRRIAKVMKYSNPSSLSRDFRKYIGTSPKEYRWKNAEWLKVPVVKEKTLADFY